jgi:hypothetical protein
MSKLGRYSADRKKIKVLTGAHTVTVAECGTIFGLASSSSGAYTVTLPKLAKAGAGWWCKFIAGVDGEDRQDWTITADTTDDTNSMTVHRTAMSSSTYRAGPGVYGTGGDPSMSGSWFGGQESSIKETTNCEFSEGNTSLNDTLELVAWVDGTNSNMWLGQAILSNSTGLT